MIFPQFSSVRVMTVGISIGIERSLPLIRLMFDTVREIGPAQPLCYRGTV